MTAKEKRTAELEALITAYQASYYNGEAEVSDAEFDALWDELKRLSPASSVLARVGADDADGFPKARHLIPMGSQEKAANGEAFRKWALKAVEKLGLSAFVAQYKLDGASLELQYEGGRLVRAVTRGDGRTGDDISANARKMKGVLADLGLNWSGGVRGEVLMFRDIWRAKYTDKANCRNAANGLMRRKDGTGCEDLNFIAYDASAAGDDGFFTTETQKIAWLRERGFAVSETAVFAAAEEVVRYRQAVSELRSSLPFDIDGLVVKDNNTNMDDLRRVRPERQIAFKFELEQALSVLRQVEWSESGATYTPIGIIDPVRLAGTTVKRANLCNPGMIRDMKLRIGSAVVVVKRGEIIPKIEGLAGDGGGGGKGGGIPIPTSCSACGAELVDAGTRLYCPNAACPKRLLHRVRKWVAVLDIREAGSKILRQLFLAGRVKRIADLYTLETEELAAFERMGELSAAKLVGNIRERRALPLADFIAGFDIEGVGSLTMESITRSGFDSLERLRAASVEELAGKFGVGETTARAIVEGLRETAEDMDAVLASGFVSIASGDGGTMPLDGQTFCFTGELRTMKRPQAEKKVKALGGSAKTSVVKGLSYLVTNEPDSGSAKNRKAKELGIPIISEDEFLRLIGE